jgi:hypothetical protein
MTDSCDDLASSWWKGAVAVPLSHGGGERAGAVALLLPRRPSRDNPTKIAIVYFCV